MLGKIDLFLSALALFTVYLWYKWSKRLSLPLPPGPRGLPVIGNLHQIPRGFQWEQYHEWCKEYGTDILYLNMAGTEVVVLDTSKPATDLLESRSSLYSGRVRMPMVNELMGWDFNPSFMDYGPRWREHRRVMHHSLHPVASKQFWPQITKATHDLLRRFLDDPDPRKIMPHLRHMAGSTILSVAYGIQIKQEDDPYIQISEQGALSLIIAAVPGAFLVDSIPLLKYIPAWFPGASFRRKAHQWYDLARRMREMPYAEAKRKLEAGTGSHSIVSQNLERMRTGRTDEALAEDVIQNVVGTLYVAGSDTTLAAITSCILGLLENPHVPKKAQIDLDSVVKAGHLPDLEDEPSLPYITAIAKETLRWGDVLPFAVPHLTSTEDEYKGYRIPAGAMVIGNAWAMLHDETVYEEPFKFNPERFIDPGTGKLDFNHSRNPGHAYWGFGRRICPGRYMAFSAIWLAIASLIYIFDFEKLKVMKRNADGEEDEETVELAHEYVSGILLVPKPFDCVIKPRSMEKAELVRSSAVPEE